MSLRNPFLPLLLIGAAVAPALLAAPQEPAAELNKSANAALLEFMRSESADSVCAMITVAGEPIFQGGLGSAKPGGTRAPHVGTPFNAASLAHTFLVTAALQLGADDKLDYEDKVASHLPDLLPKDCGVRVKDLMSQTSGLADYRDFAKADVLANGQPTYQALAQGILEVAPVTAPGECVAITGTNSLLLAALLEKISGQSADELLQVKLFDLLKMEDTHYGLGPAIRNASSGEEPQATPAFLGRGLSSTVADLGKFQRGLLELRLFDSNTLERMGDLVQLGDGSASNYGFGVRQVELHGSAGLVLGEPTGTSAGACQIAHYPEFDLSVMVMARGPELSIEELSRDLARLIIERPESTTLDLLLSQAQSKPYLGSFQIGCTTVVIGAEGGRVVMDELDQDPIVFLYQGQHRFIARDDSDITITFQLNGDFATSFMLERHGFVTKAVRLSRG